MRRILLLACRSYVTTQHAKEASPKESLCLQIIIITHWPIFVESEELGSLTIFAYYLYQVVPGTSAGSVFSAKFTIGLLFPSERTVVGNYSVSPPFEIRYVIGPLLFVTKSDVY
jgi:hypothetical protein